MDVMEMAHRITMIDPYGEFTKSDYEMAKMIEEKPEEVIEMLLLIIEEDRT